MKSRRRRAKTLAEQRRLKLLQDELDRFISEASGRMRLHRVLLFGSLATGEIHEWSDLDIVVVADTTLPFLDRIKDVMSRFHPKVGMDILIYTPEEWNTLTKERPFIQEEVIKKGKVVYERSNQPMA